MLLNHGVGEDSWESPWTARRSSQSILKEMSPEYSLEGLMLKVKLQYFGHLMLRTNSFEKRSVLGVHWKDWCWSWTPMLWPPDAKSWLIWKDPDAGKDWRQDEKGQQRMRWLDGITDLIDTGLSKLRSWWWTGRPGVLQFMWSQRVRHDWETELNWV